MRLTGWQHLTWNVHYSAIKYYIGAAQRENYDSLNLDSKVPRAPLKPDEKLHLLKRYILSRLYQGLQTPTITQKVLEEADRIIRKAVRRILPLNVHTGSQFLCASIRDGGLRIPQIRYLIT